MSEVDEAVARFARALHMERDVLERELAAELTDAARRVEMSLAVEGDRTALERSDTPIEPQDPGALLAWLHGDVAWQRMRTTALPVAEAAARLGLTDSAVRRVLGPAAGDAVELLGVKDSRGRWRVFEYQLPDSSGDGGEPGGTTGRRVQRALPPGMHPVAVAAWWDAPNAALYLDGVELAPREWVRRRLDPDQVIDAARHEDAV